MFIYFFFISGPVVGIVGQRYGIRSVTLFGAVIAALGAALCFIAPSIGWLAFCWGGIHGKLKMNYVFLNFLKWINTATLLYTDKL